jgi:hypothetical protein
MAGVTGLGGAFVRADNPEALYAWYEKHLAFPVLMDPFFCPRNAACLHCRCLLPAFFEVFSCLAACDAQLLGG